MNANVAKCLLDVEKGNSLLSYFVMSVLCLQLVLSANQLILRRHYYLHFFSQYLPQFL